MVDLSIWCGRAISSAAIGSCDVSDLNVIATMRAFITASNHRLGNDYSSRMIERGGLKWEYQTKTR